MDGERREETVDAGNSAIGCRFPSARPSPGLVTGLLPRRERLS